jgi:16S rRNA (guanine1516-N2)-methyltransferase
MSHIQMYQGRLAVCCESPDDRERHQKLAQRLSVPCYTQIEAQTLECVFLGWRQGALTLYDRNQLRKGGMVVEVEPRPGEQKSWPAPKTGALAQAVGRKTHTIIDATTGWGQDALHLFRMGYQVRCLERSPVMFELLQDGWNRLGGLDWVGRLKLSLPELVLGNSIDILAKMSEKPDCIYLDPMFPPKRKKSALAKKSMVILRDLLGDDLDRERLFEVALQAAGKKVIVKCPDDATPLGRTPDESFKGKLLRFDVYRV